MTAFAATLAVLVLAAGCASPPEDLERLYARTLGELSGARLSDHSRTHQRSLDRVRSLAESGALEKPEDLFHAAAILSTSLDQADLELALELARRASARGEPRASVVEADLTDQLLIRAGAPQRYGTQVAWSPVLEEWILYPVDPATTDDERRAMGLPGLAELRERAQGLASER